MIKTLPSRLKEAGLLPNLNEASQVVPSIANAILLKVNTNELCLHPLDSQLEYLIKNSVSLLKEEKIVLIENLYYIPLEIKDSLLEIYKQEIDSFEKILKDYNNSK